MHFLVHYCEEYTAPISLDPGEQVLVGRDAEECDLALLNPGVSHRHCRLSVVGAWAWVEDLDSTNGTYVNGEMVRSSPLAPGDTIQVGGCTIEVG